MATVTPDNKFNDYAASTKTGHTGVGNLGPTFTGHSTAAAGASADLASEVVKATFDKAMAWKARLEPMYRSFATIRPGSLVHPGTGIDMFRMYDDLAIADTPLDEYADPDAVPLTKPEKITLQANEYGNATVTTLRLREYSWADIDPIQVELVARNMRDSIDSLYSKAIYAAKGGFGSGVTGGNGFVQMATPAAKATKLTVGSGATAGQRALNASDVRQIVAHFRNHNVPTYGNGLYLGLITPDAAVKLREETDVAGWRYPHLDGSQSGPIWQNTVGVFEGVSFLESPLYAGRAAVANGADAGAALKATDDVQNLLFLGQPGLAEVVIREPGAVVMPQVDRFNRFLGIGWYAFLGAGIYDGDAGVKVSVKNSTVGT